MRGSDPASADDRLQTITNLGPGTSGTISQFTYGYNAVGDITSRVQQTGTNTAAYQYGYDGADQLLRATAPVNGSQSLVDAYGYRYDPAGNRTVEQTGTTVTTSAYSNLNQMTSRSGGGLLTISGSLNKPGIVTVSGTPYMTDSNNAFSAVASVVTGPNNIQISATNANGYGITKTLSVNITGGTPIPQLTYDLDGNLTNDGTLKYEWDAANRLTAVDYPTGARSKFAYDGLGRRVQIVETGTNGAVTSTKNLVWDGMSICEEKNASGAVTKAYFSQGVQIGGSNYYYTRDHLGSIREIVAASGTVQAQYDYDPYGRQTQLSGTMAADFGFTGDYFHVPSQLCLTVYRAYSPNFGRWLSRDPFKDAEQVLGPDLYEYVLNDPINGNDPSGLHDVTGSGPIAIDDDGTGPSYGDPDANKGHHTSYKPDLDADTDSYVVAPLTSISQGVKAGQSADATGNGHSITSIVGDFGPAWGEVSIAAARALGIHIKFSAKGPLPKEDVTITVTVHVPDTCKKPQS